MAIPASTNADLPAEAATPAVHYDAKAAAAGAPGDRPRLNTFHNRVKRELLRFVCDRLGGSGGGGCGGGCAALLDLACGRGGDVHKWIDLGVPCVKGLDVSARSLQEARERYAARRPACSTECTFEQADLTMGVWRDGNGGPKYDVVTCMFAAHYFFGSETVAKALFGTVVANLKPGGFFVGVVPDAQQINERIRHGSTYDNGYMRVTAEWQGKPRCFGSAYRCSIQGTVTEDSLVPEYLVYANVLTALAREHGLDPVPLNGVAGLDSTAGGPMYALAPPPAYAGPMADCSRVFAAFAFQKGVRVCEELL